MKFSQKIYEGCTSEAFLRCIQDFSYSDNIRGFFPTKSSCGSIELFKNFYRIFFLILSFPTALVSNKKSHNILLIVISKIFFLNILVLLWEFLQKDMRRFLYKLLHILLNNFKTSLHSFWEGFFQKFALKTRLWFIQEFPSRKLSSDANEVSYLLEKFLRRSYQIFQEFFPKFFRRFVWEVKRRLLYKFIQQFYNGFL